MVALLMHMLHSSGANLQQLKVEWQDARTAAHPPPPKKNNKNTKTLAINKTNPTIRSSFGFGVWGLGFRV